jgi:hypothetical protein
VVGELNLCCERLALHLAWRVVVEVVEPCLADCDDAVGIEQVDDRIDPVDGVVRMETDRGPHVGMVGGDLDRRL